MGEHIALSFGGSTPMASHSGHNEGFSPMLAHHFHNRAHHFGKSGQPSTAYS
jgi:hypothetical protein